MCVTVSVRNGEKKTLKLIFYSGKIATDSVSYFNSVESSRRLVEAEQQSWHVCGPSPLHCVVVSHLVATLFRWRWCPRGNGMYLRPTELVRLLSLTGGRFLPGFFFSVNTCSWSTTGPHGSLWGDREGGVATYKG